MAQGSTLQVKFCSVFNYRLTEISLCNFINPLCVTVNGLLLHMEWPFKVYTLTLLTHHFLGNQWVEHKETIHSEWKPTWQLH
jgi:hypothetical protein